ncbi:unnamed protein product [Trichogramma brassicae]|uniref:Uncharacterized protein n=1 Tax=Trichogramma brassicae TaxID=86971 RepID=A0A6H5HXK5_9HYME|nr:unnamed protein product [Trichogramma brassicae]
MSRTGRNGVQMKIWSTNLYPSETVYLPCNILSQRQNGVTNRSTTNTESANNGVCLNKKLNQQHEQNSSHKYTYTQTRNTLKPNLMYAQAVSGLANHHELQQRDPEVTVEVEENRPINNINNNNERLQSKVLRGIVDAPWYITNETIKKDLEIPTVREEIQRFNNKYKKRLKNHPNQLAANLENLNFRLMLHGEKNVTNIVRIHIKSCVPPIRTRTRANQVHQQIRALRPPIKVNALNTILLIHHHPLATSFATSDKASYESNQRVRNNNRGAKKNQNFTSSSHDPFTAPIFTAQVCNGKSRDLANRSVIRLTDEHESNNARAQIEPRDRADLQQRALADDAADATTTFHAGQQQRADAAHAADAPPRYVNRVAVKLSAFWMDKPAIWFAQAEAQFALADVTVELTKYYHVISQLNLSVKIIAVSHEYSDILAEFPTLTLPPVWPREIKHDTVHHIRTTPGPPISSRFRHLAGEKLTIAKNEYDQMLELGICRPSESPWSSPLHLASVGSNGWRACGDFRALNSRTLPDRYPVRHIHDFVNNIDGCQIFSTIDLVKAYQQIPVHPDDVCKTAITTPFGLYEFPFMTFGLKNAGQIFQRFMDEMSVKSFIERVEECSFLAGLTDRDLLLGLSETLTGTAAKWYRSNRYSFRTWDDFCKAARRMFGIDRYGQQQLLEQIKKRTQGPDERVAEYIICIQSVFSKLRPELDVQTQLDYLHGGMLPDLQKMVCRRFLRSIDDLLEEAVEAENTIRKANQYRAPTSDENTWPELRYKPGKSEDTSYRLASMSSPKDEEFTIRQAQIEATRLLADSIKELQSRVTLLEDKPSEKNETKVLQQISKLITKLQRHSFNQSGKPGWQKRHETRKNKQQGTNVLSTLNVKQQATGQPSRPAKTAILPRKYHSASHSAHYRSKSGLGDDSLREVAMFLHKYRPGIDSRPPQCTPDAPPPSRRCEQELQRDYSTSNGSSSICTRGHHRSSSNQGINELYCATRVCDHILVRHKLAGSSARHSPLQHIFRLSHPGENSITFSLLRQPKLTFLVLRQRKGSRCDRCPCEDHAQLWRAQKQPTQAVCSRRRLHTPVRSPRLVHSSTNASLHTTGGVSPPTSLPACDRRPAACRLRGHICPCRHTTAGPSRGRASAALRPPPRGRKGRGTLGNAEQVAGSMGPVEEGPMDAPTDPKYQSMDREEARRAELPPHAALDRAWLLQTP